MSAKIYITYEISPSNFFNIFFSRMNFQNTGQNILNIKCVLFYVKCLICVLILGITLLPKTECIHLGILTFLDNLAHLP